MQASLEDIHVSPHTNVSQSHAWKLLLNSVLTFSVKNSPVLSRLLSHALDRVSCVFLLSGIRMGTQQRHAWKLQLAALGTWPWNRCRVNYFKTIVITQKQNLMLCLWKTRSDTNCVYFLHKGFPCWNERNKPSQGKRTRSWRIPHIILSSWLYFTVVVELHSVY